MKIAKTRLKWKADHARMPPMLNPFTEKVLAVIKNIPPGKVLSYGRVAALAGNPRAARQVSRLLHSMSEKHNLPWHRVIGANGRISLPPEGGYALQKALLESEGVEFSINDRIDLEAFLWDGEVPQVPDTPEPWDAF